MQPGDRKPGMDSAILEPAVEQAHRAAAELAD
jgi:hypothetical protein